MLRTAGRGHLRPVGHPRDPVQRPGGRERGRGVRRRDVRRRLRPRRGGRTRRRSRSATRRCRCSQDPPKLLAAPAGELHQRASSRRAPRRAWTTTGSRSPPIDQQGTLFAGEFAVVGTRNRPEVEDFLEQFMGEDVQCAMGGDRASSRISPNVNVGPDCYANPILADASVVLTEALAGGTRSLRRLRPDAGGGRFGELLDRDGAVHAGRTRLAPDASSTRSRRAGRPNSARPTGAGDDGGSGRERPLPAAASSEEDEPGVSDPTSGRASTSRRPTGAGPQAVAGLDRLALRLVCVSRSRSSPSSSSGRFDFLRDDDANRFLVVGVAIVVGVGGVFFLYWGMNRVVDLLPARFREGVRPYVFVGPALVILAVFLVYPVFNTILVSFKDAQRRGLRRPRQLPVRLHRREHAPVDPEHVRVDHHRPARRR